MRTCPLPFSPSLSLSFSPALLAAIACLSVASAGCIDRRASAAPAATATSSGPSSTTTPTSAIADRHVYRFDFVFTTSDGGTSTATSFTLNLEDAQRGEVLVGKNVSLSAAPAGGGPPSGGPRQDVGLKVVAVFWTMGGDDALLELTTEMSTVEGQSSIRKVVSKGDALATPGKSTLVMSLDDEHKRYQLTVTPTKLR